MSRRPPRLLVVGLGGNAVSPPAGDLSFAAERAAIDQAAGELAALAADATRLLVVHGNGPQVGRLLAAPNLGDGAALDIHVAQTQGEIGYLLAEALERARPARRVASLMTRVLVDAADPAFACPEKPVGPLLAGPVADSPCRAVPGGGYRRVVASPRPRAVLEADTIRALLEEQDVVAGGGGGIPLVEMPNGRRSVAAVVDKDWVAALLAVQLGATRLLFVTDVTHAFEDFATRQEMPIAVLTCSGARAGLERGIFPPGSMGPKIASAVEFVAATGRPAVVTALGQVEAGLMGTAGTRIVPDDGDLDRGE
jgi:carbamate kinase